MGKPAARVTDMTAHGGMITGPGVPTVLIGGLPAATVGDMHMCPMVTPGVPPIPHVGGPITGPGCPTVLIGGKPAAVMGDMAVCVGPPSTIVGGCPTVLIGTGGGGGAQAPAKPVAGTEALPIAVQSMVLDYAPQLNKEQLAILIAHEVAEHEKRKEELTIADFVEILEGIERDEGYEAARFFAAQLKYTELCELTRNFVKGVYPEPKNDPNIMPTRFMILYGADDAKLKKIDDHHDGFAKDKHKINVVNLRKGLRLLGYDVKESGAYDDEVFIAHLNYMCKHIGGKRGVYDEVETEYSEFKITIDIDPNDPATKNDTFTLYSGEFIPKYKQTKTVKDDADSTDNKLQLVFTQVDKSLRYTLEVDFGDGKETERLFKNKTFGRWK